LCQIRLVLDKNKKSLHLTGQLHNIGIERDFSYKS
jgi:hypothetical protein